MSPSRSVVSVLLRSWETFLYILKAGPAGGRHRRPSSAGNDSSVTLPCFARLYQGGVA
jgi:hypothetical protein